MIQKTKKLTEKEWVRISEYAKLNKMTVPGVWWRIKIGAVEYKKEFGLALVRDK